MSSFERRALTLLGIRTHFHELSLRLKVAVTQLPLVISVLIALPLVALVSPETFTEERFRQGLALLAVTTAAAVAIPWDRLFVPAYWLIPLLDFGVICLLYSGGRNSVTGLSLLCVLPVFWLAWSGAARKLAALLSFAGTVLVVWSPLFAAGQTELRDLAAPMLIPFIMLAIFGTVSTVERDNVEQQKQLRAAKAELQESLLESRHSSALLSAVLDTVDVGVLALDRHGKIILMNNRQVINHQLTLPVGTTSFVEETLEIFGLDRRTQVPPHARPAQRAMRGESFSDYVVWLGSGERQRALAVAARPVTDDDGAFNGSVLAFSDVTDMVNALQTKDDFVANVSHELRTPLTSILGYLDLALEEAEDRNLAGPIPSALLVVQRNAERLLTLVSDLLTTASDSLQLVLSEEKLGELIEIALDSAGPRAQAAGVELRSELAGDLILRADAGRILQVLDNLLSNAIKYSPGGGVVTVRAWAQDESVIMEVADTGMGMSVLDQLEVFTKFFRTGSVRKAAIPGVGLGLVITKSIVEAHGGLISLESELGVGTTFRVELSSKRS
ncbi:ATP-binding protein [Arthrobacter sp. APC 3897]|uniref:sensor histidine kinase n=1 Tax=Arthrobacter sp. APC 3897 TaxID=3035204 RepID=UPI0025B2F8A4|nr:ATP-binding protein [Arthrobacter sp. APC 3897]MDN3481513.1 ATP-binding protein [Arthrobacter sp. APC 3897]